MNTSCAASRVSTLPATNGGGMYAATKAGADMLMKCAAIEVSPRGGYMPIFFYKLLLLYTKIAKSPPDTS